MRANPAEAGSLSPSPPQPAWTRASTRALTWARSGRGASGGGCSGRRGWAPRTTSCRRTSPSFRWALCAWPTCSSKAEMSDARKLPLMQYVVCLAMAEAIKELTCAKGLSELDVRIKWPNDLYLNGLKVGGILCTSSYQPKVYNICTGIGLNVDNEEPTTCLNAALKKLNADSPGLKQEDILASFFNKFEDLFEIFTNQGFKALEERYYNSWLHSGQRVIVQDAPEGQGQSVDSVVTIQGLSPSGYLHAIGDDGKSYELHPDGNSFDFFRGLVRRKFKA